MAADVRIRLSAEGEAQVVAAFRKVQAEAARVSQASAASVGGIGRNIRGVSDIVEKLRHNFFLAKFATAVAVGGFVAFTKSVADSADELARVADTTGLSVTQFSALKAVAAQDDVGVEQLRRTLVHFRSTIAEVEEGSGKGARALQTLGISADSFKGRSTAEQLELVARSLFEVENKGKGANAFVDLFGERAAVLIPVMRRLGEEGFANLIREGVELGTIFDERLVRSAGALGDEVDKLGGQLRSLSTRFVGGFAAPVIAALQSLESALGKDASAWETWGARVGRIVGVGILLLEHWADAIAQITAKHLIQLESFTRGSIAIMRQNFVLAGAISAEANRRVDSLEQDFNKRLARRRAALAKFQIDITSGAIGLGQFTAASPLEPPEDDARERATAAALEARRSASQAELQLTQAKLKADQEENERSFDQSLVSLASYFAERRRIQQSGFAAEIAALQRRRLVELEEPDARKSAKAIADIDAELARKDVEHKAASVALTFEQIRAEEKLRTDRIKFESEISRARGDQHTARMAEIAEETRAFRDQLIREGKSIEEASAQSNLFSTTLTATEDFAEANRLAVREMETFNATRDEVQRQLDAGLISQVESEARILGIERERLERLQEIATQLTLTAEISGSPESIEQAREFSAAVEQVALGVERSENLGRRLGATFQDIGVGSVRSFFSEMRRGAQDGLEAMRNWALGVLDSIAQVIEQMLALQIVTAALRFPGLGGGGGGGLGLGVGAGNIFPGPAHAVGGPVRGPGTGTSDSIVARLSAGEYVTRAARVRQGGVLSLLDVLNYGSDQQVRTLLSQVELGARTVLFRERGELTGFAGGGLVPAAGTDVAGAAMEPGRFDGSVTLKLAPGLVVEELESKEAGRIIVRQVNGHRRALGGG